MKALGPPCHSEERIPEKDTRPYSSPRPPDCGLIATATRPPLPGPSCYHKTPQTDGLSSTGIHLSQPWRMASPRSRCWETRLVRPQFLVHGKASSSFVPGAGRARMPAGVPFTSV